jgi:drug/metabolite transporter (DMT)-like permease
VPIPKVSAVSSWPAVVALIAATAVWGSTFVVTKQSLDQIAPATFLAWRFGIAAAVLVAIRPAKVRALSSTERREGLGLGLLLGSGFLLQTIGLQSTPSGVSGFLTGTAVILTPVAAAALFSERVGAAGWAAVGVAALGVVLVAGGGALTPAPGAVLTLAGAVCFTGHITGLSQWATKGNAYGITAFSVSVAAVVCGAAALFTGDLTLPPTGVAWGAVIVASMFAAELGPRKCCDAMSPRVECC